MPSSFRRRNTLSRPLLTARADGGIRLGDAVEEFLKTLGLDQQVALGQIEEQWAAAVGPLLAQHTRPGRLERGDLVILVDNSAWLSEIQRYARTELLGKLQERFGKDRIRRLRLQIDPGHD